MYYAGMDPMTPSFVQVSWSFGSERRRVAYAPSLVCHVVAWMREIYPSFNLLPTAAGRELASDLRGRRMEELALSLLQPAAVGGEGPECCLGKTVELTLVA